MKLLIANTKSASAAIDLRQARSIAAFTMVEIAIALGVIGFALVAIVGILPLGLNAQRDNREDTIINQDGAYFTDAIRGGIRGLDELTNFVERIVVTSSNAINFRRTEYVNKNLDPDTSSTLFLTNGEQIIDLLSIPKYRGGRTNEVIAYVRALSGSALEQGGSNSMVALRYQLRSEVVPNCFFSYESTNFLDPKVDPNSFEWMERSNRWVQTRFLSNNLYEVRLQLSWPLKPNDELPDRPKWQLFRTMVSAHQNANNLFEPQTYAP